jgi:hypothetical protein
MTIIKKKLYEDFDQVAANQLTDEVPVKQTTNKVTTLQKIYNLFKTSFDAVYTTTAAVAAQITTALSPYATTAYVNNLVATVYRAAGEWDASGGGYPTIGTGTAGAVRQGDTYNVTVAGGDFDIGDSFYSKVDNPGQDANNWARFEANTQQATESTRGTAKVVTLANLQDDASTNDTDIITPVKFWDVLKNTFMGLAEFSAGVAAALITNLPSGSGPIVAGEALDLMLSKLQTQLNTAVNLPGGLAPGLAPLKVGASTNLPIDISESDMRVNADLEIIEGKYLYLTNDSGQRVRISVDGSNNWVITPV